MWAQSTDSNWVWRKTTCRRRLVGVPVMRKLYREAVDSAIYQLAVVIKHLRVTAERTPAADAVVISVSAGTPASRTPPHLRDHPIRVSMPANAAARESILSGVVIEKNSPKIQYCIYNYDSCTVTLITDFSRISLKRLLLFWVVLRLSLLLTTRTQKAPMSKWTVKHYLLLYGFVPKMTYVVLIRTLNNYSILWAYIPFARPLGGNFFVIPPWSAWWDAYFTLRRK